MVLNINSITESLGKEKYFGLANKNREYLLESLRSLGEGGDILEVSSCFETGMMSSHFHKDLPQRFFESLRTR